MHAYTENTINTVNYVAHDQDTLQPRRQTKNTIKKCLISEIEA